MEHGYDWAWADVRGQNIVAGGGTFAVRYLGGSASLTDAEAAELHSAGIAILLVFEQEATLAEGGFSRGVQAALAANAQADQLGYPPDCVIFYADDNNDADTSQEVEFMRGVLSVGGRPAGIYSGGNVCAAVRAAFPQVYTWRVETWFPADYPNPDLEQLANTRDPAMPGVDPGSYDTDLLFDAIPMWGPYGNTINGEQDMTPEESTVLHKILANLEGDHAGGAYGYPDANSIGVRLANVYAHVVGIPDGPYATESISDQVSKWFGQLQDHIDAAVAALPAGPDGSVTKDDVRAAVADTVAHITLEVKE